MINIIKVQNSRKTLGRKFAFEKCSAICMCSSDLKIIRKMIS